uniref:Uncharacterized protein n=1 Tax=Anguilla anguilla TaxID=7936 RepID=A0A0E9TNK1_ANGAN
MDNFSLIYMFGM